MRLWPAILAMVTSTLTTGCQTDAPAQSPDAAPEKQAPASENTLLTTEPPAPESSGEPPAVTEDSTPPPSETGASTTAFIFDRVMVKLANPDRFAEDATLIAFVEQKTGMKVATIRRAPLAVVLVTFEATTPPRDKTAQASLTASLSGLPEFKYVEPDRLRQPR